MAGMEKTHGVAQRELLFDGDLNIRRVAELKQELEEAIRQSAVVEIDLRQAETIDLCVLQLFCSAQRTAAALDHSLRIRGPLCAAVEEIVAVTGLGKLLQGTQQSESCTSHSDGEES